MILKLLVGVVAAYVLLCATMFLAQERFIFHPTAERGLTVEPGMYGFNRVSFRTNDGVGLVGWFHEDPKRDKAVVFFYGNADSLSGYGAFFNAFAAAGYSVLGVNYRGYGGSEGEPSEEGFYRDGDAALAFLNRYVTTEKVVVIGRSIGSGVAVDLAARNRVKVLALISPFTSLTDIASEVFWYLPVRYLLKHKFASSDKIKQVTAPVLVIHGDADRLVPLQNGKALYAAANAPKQLSILTGADHNYMNLNEISSIIISFDQVQNEN